MTDVSTLPLLPQEILVEILSKLPAKSLVRFRRVSKFFCSLVIDPLFADLHRNWSLTLPSRATILIHFKPERYPPVFSRVYYTINFSGENQEKLQANRVQYLDGYDDGLGTSSDGLICLSRSNGDVGICNISTTQHVSLPRIQSVTPSTMSAHLCYDSFAKRYNVWMSGKKFAGQYKHWVFTLGVSKSWREINCSFSFLPIYSSTSVHIDGVIYSINFPAPRGEGLNIVAFDIRVERFSMIPFPDELSSSEGYLLSDSGLVVVDGRLAIVQIHISEIGVSYMDVWSWEKSMEWEKIITIPIPLEESQMIREVRVFRIITSTLAGEIVLLLGIIRECLTMLVCNLKRQVWRKFDIGGVEDFPVNLPTWNVNMHSIVDNVFSLE